MSAALRHHKQQLHIGYRPRVGITATTNAADATMSSNNNMNNNNNDSNDDDEEDNHTNSSHCSLSDEPNHHSLLSSSELLLRQQRHPQQPPPHTSLNAVPKYAIGTSCKKYFHGHGWCSGEVIAFTKGRYKVRFDRPNMTTGTTTQKDICYDVEEMPRLRKTASVIPGTRVEIYWPQVRQYYTAMIKTEQTRKRENYLICYEDARHKRTSTDREWIDLHRHKFRIIAQPPPEDDVVVVTAPLPPPAAPPVPHRTTTVRTAVSKHNIVATAPPSGCNNIQSISHNNKLRHPREVTIEQDDCQQSKLTSTDSGSISSGTVMAPFGEAAIRATTTTSTTIVPIPIKSEYMHLVSNVPSNNEDFESGAAKGDAAMDTSQGGTDASIEPTQTIISMEMEDDMKKIDANGADTHAFLPSDPQEFCSPGSSSASTHRSVVLQVPECDNVNVPRLDKSHNDAPQNTDEHFQQTDQYSLRRVSQETMNDTNNTMVMLQKSSSNSDTDTMEVEISPRSKGKKIAMPIIDSDDSATELKPSSNADNMNDNDEEEGIVIDPDNDEATKTAICSLIQIGSRVAVYSEFNDQFFPGTITDRKYRGKPFYITYDDDEAEWIDLRKQRFRLLPSSTTTTMLQSATSSSSSIIMAQNENSTNGYRSTRRSSYIQMSNVGKSPNKQSASTEDTTKSLLKSHIDTFNTEMSAQSKRSLLETSEQLDSPAKSTAVLKRSERSTTKPLRFQDLCDTTDSDEGISNTKPVRRKKRTVDKSNQVDHDISNITIGTRVAVWWGGDKQYYNAVVTRQRTYKKPFYIEYDGTDEAEWIDFRKNKFKILPPSKTTATSDHAVDDSSSNVLRSPKHTDSPKRFRLGSPEKQNDLKKKHDGNANKHIGTDKKRKRDVIDDSSGNLDDDDDDDSVEAAGNKNNNEDVCNLITVGARVSVYWEGDSKYYDGTVTRERKNLQKKHYLEYDDGEAAHWIDFREHWVRLLPPVPTESKSNASVGNKKRKVELDVDTTTQHTNRSLPDKTAVTIIKEDSKRQSKMATSTDSNNAKKSNATKENARLNVDSKQKLSDKGNTKEQKDVNSKRKATSRSNVDPLCETIKVTVGTRVEVWWDGDGRYYEGTIIKLGPNQNKKHYVRYDDNEEAWVYFAKNRVRLLNPMEEKTQSKSTTKVSSKSTDKTDTKLKHTAVVKKSDKVLSKSTDIPSTKASNTVAKKNDQRVEKHTASKRIDNVDNTAKKGGSGATSAGKGVAKKGDESTTVKRKRANKKKIVKPVAKKIESESDRSDDSDDASSEDHYAYSDFVYGNVEKLKVGSRISVWWTGDRRYFDGTIKKIDSTVGCRRPFYIKYDDNDTEWTDLRRRYFRFLD